MTTIDSQGSKPFVYPSKTVKRAETALVCSPFRLNLLETMRSESVDLKAIAQDAGVQNGFTQRPVSEIAAETTLMWLIQVGVLRREVDGQGITDSFRLTPLGRQLVEQYQGSAWRQPSWRDRLQNLLNRWLRLPF